MKTATEEKIEPNAPSIPYQAMKLASSAANYRQELSKAIRHIADYTREQLKEKGIVDDKGKINAMGMWSYINDHVGAKLRGKHFANPDEYRLVVPYNVVNSLVRKYKNVDSLMEYLATTYGNAGRQFAATKVSETISAKKPDVSKPALRVISGVTSDYTANKETIDGLTDPQEAASLGNQLFESLLPKVEENVAAGTLKDLEQKVADAEHQMKLAA